MLNFRRFRMWILMQKLKETNYWFAWEEMHSSKLYRIRVERWNSIDFWINSKQNFKDNRVTNQASLTFDVDVEITEIVVECLWFRNTLQILNHFVWVLNRKDRKMKKRQTLQLSTLLSFELLAFVFLVFVVLKSSLMRKKEDDLLNK